MITVSEVGPRDGVQSLDFLVDLEIKKQWIASEAAAGVPEIEVGRRVVLAHVLLPGCHYRQSGVGPISQTDECSY